MNQQGNSASGGVGVTGLLQLAFIVLKLCGVINWSWWLVLTPTWGMIVFALILARIDNKN